MTKSAKAVKLVWFLGSLAVGIYLAWWWPTGVTFWTFLYIVLSIISIPAALTIAAAASAPEIFKSYSYRHGRWRRDGEKPTE
jgi:hypothetical protein